MITGLLFGKRLDTITSSDSKISGFTVHMHVIRFDFVADLFFFHYGECIEKYPDSMPNSPDACGRKTYSERKSCGFKNIWIGMDGA